ncbi:hypothetical protein SNEBB_000335 [Seison nebaliae]|nr:hypothetical protein SNEBB_000335 [Seison nebaliae]
MKRKNFPLLSHFFHFILPFHIFDLYVTFQCHGNPLNFNFAIGFLPTMVTAKGTLSSSEFFAIATIIIISTITVILLIAVIIIATGNIRTDDPKLTRPSFRGGESQRIKVSHQRNYSPYLPPQPPPRPVSPAPDSVFPTTPTKDNERQLLEKYEQEIEEEISEVTLDEDGNEENGFNNVKRSKITRIKEIDQKGDIVESTVDRSEEETQQIVSEDETEKEFPEKGLLKSTQAIFSSSRDTTPKLQVRIHETGRDSLTRTDNTSLYISPTNSSARETGTIQTSFEVTATETETDSPIESSSGDDRDRSTIEGTTEVSASEVVTESEFISSTDRNQNNTNTYSLPITSYISPRLVDKEGRRKELSREMFQMHSDDDPLRFISADYTSASTIETET